jgi:hypothetical protein
VTRRKGEETGKATISTEFKSVVLMTTVEKKEYNHPKVAVGYSSSK